MGPRTAHSQSCKQCKQVIHALLVDAFGSDVVAQQYRLGLPSVLQGYKQHPYFSVLAAIESDLKAYRGFTSLGAQRTLPPVDFFVKSVGLIVEFDETQHFTAPRAIALRRYPDTLALGFNRDVWLGLCSKLSRHDHRPPYRDEQRAWLDTLRDFAPAYLALRPAIRIYAGATVWCRADTGRGAKSLAPYAPEFVEALGAQPECAQ
jgi:hypothetical protein